MALPRLFGGGSLSAGGAAFLTITLTLGVSFNWSSIWLINFAPLLPWGTSGVAGRGILLTNSSVAELQR